MSVEEAVQSNATVCILAQAFLSEYFCDKQVTYPINSSQMLSNLGVPFVFVRFPINAVKGCICRLRVKMILLLWESI